MTETTPSEATPAPTRATGSAMITAGAAALAGILAAAVSYVLIGAIGDNLYEFPPEIQKIREAGIPGAEDQARIAAAQRFLLLKHSRIWMSVTGGVLGLLVGAAIAFVSGSKQKPLIIVACFVTTALLGVGAGPIAFYMEGWVHENIPEGALEPPEHYVMGMHAATWLVMGLGLGLGTSAVSLVAGRIPQGIKAIVVGTIAGLVGGGVFPIIAAVLMPATDAKTALPIADDAAGRFLWLCFPMVVISFILGHTVAQDNASKKVAAEPQPEA